MTTIAINNQQQKAEGSALVLFLLVGPFFLRTVAFKSDQWQKDPETSGHMESTEFPSVDFQTRLIRITCSENETVLGFTFGNFDSVGLRL